MLRAEAVVVLLPNMYSLLTRFRYVKENLSAKYDFPPDPVLVGIAGCRALIMPRSFVNARPSRAGWNVTAEYGFDGGFRRLTACGG
jgi:hypothetical protein